MTRVEKKASSCGEKVENWREKKICNWEGSAVKLALRLLASASQRDQWTAAELDCCSTARKGFAGRRRRGRRDGQSEYGRGLDWSYI